RDGRAERRRELAADALRDERLRALSGAVELQDVEAVVVGLDERGQRAALAQRRDVAGGGDSAEVHRAVTLPHAARLHGGTRRRGGRAPRRGGRAREARLPRAEALPRRVQLDL